MNAPHSPGFSFNTLPCMLEPLKNTLRDKMRQNETVCARVPSAACTKAINTTRVGPDYIGTALLLVRRGASALPDGPRHSSPAACGQSARRRQSACLIPPGA